MWKTLNELDEGTIIIFSSVAKKEPKIKSKCNPFPLLLENTGCKNNKHFLLKSNYSQN